ncbi:MAG: O-antigen ligase family protein [Solirubrobacteraceae bacterium]
MNSDRRLAVLLAGALAVLAFVTAGGVDLAPNSWAEIALVVIGATAAGSVVLLGAGGPRWGMGTVGLFLALSVLTAGSIGWSVVPDSSWVEAGRTLSYLAAFAAAAALARVWPARWRALIGGVTLFAVLLSAYALLVKVVPGALDPHDTLGRLKAPFDYWNATGLLAALALPGCLWVGSRRTPGRVLRALSLPASAVCIAVVVLSYSRSAVLAAVAGVAVWLLWVPLRLRSAAILLIGGIAGAIISLWALSTPALTHDKQALGARISEGRWFGVVLLVVLAATAVAGLAGARRVDRVILGPQTRRRAGKLLIILLALVPVAGLAALASSSRGLAGEVSHVWSALTGTNQIVGDNPGRLVELGSSRPLYWREGISVGEHHPLLGVGALGFGTARTRYTSSRLIVAHAHSYLVQTFADFGILGLLVSLGLLGCWGAACRRSLARPDQLGSQPSDVGEELAEQRAGLYTLLAIVVAYGVQSAIDWTWFFPGVTVPALLCAGWLAGRGPVLRPIGRRVQRVTLARAPGRAVVLTALLAATLVGAWAIWQPLRSADADSAAVDAAGRGASGTAIADARAAAAEDPVAVSPLWNLSAFFTALGDRRAALAELNQAISLQPENPETWRALGYWYLQQGEPRHAVAPLIRARRLDGGDVATIEALGQAQQAVAGGAAR